MKVSDYLDTVLAHDGKVLFNGDPDAVVEWLTRMKGWDVLLGKEPHVISGYSLHAYSIDDYISFRNGG